MTRAIWALRIVLASWLIAAALVVGAVVIACGGAPSDDVVETRSAFTFPPGGIHWYDSYWSTRKDCGFLGAYNDSGIGAVLLEEANVGWQAGLAMISDPVAYAIPNGWTQLGAMPDPGQQPTTNGQPPLCTVALEWPQNSEADVAGFAHGSWALPSNATHAPCGVRLWGQQMGPLLIDELAGGYWANWVLEPELLGAPATQGWRLRASGQIMTPSGAASPCTFSTVAYLYQAPSPYPR